MSNRFYSNAGHFYAPHVMPVLLDCNFVVDSTNANGLGISSLKGPGIANVFMNTTAGAPAGSPALGSARSYAALAATAITNTGSSVLTGNLGMSPGTAVTGFPPGSFSGSQNIANAAASAAQASALAAYTDLSTRTATPITAVLDGQTLAPGVYSEASSTFRLAQSGNATLTLNGAGVYVFIAASTLVTGAGGIPTMNLTGGATAANIYWVVGSSATINSGSAGTFQGNVIAVASITDTLGGTVNGSLIALNGAVTLSAASTIVSQPLSVVPASGNLAQLNPNPGPGIIVVQLSDNYNRLLGQEFSVMSPLTGSALTSVVNHTAYVITSVGTATQAQWQALGLPKGVTPAIGAAFIASQSAAIPASGAVKVPGVSGIDSMEMLGNPNKTLSPVGIQSTQGIGSQILLQTLLSGSLVPPADGSVIELQFYLSNSSVVVAGEG